MTKDNGGPAFVAEISAAYTENDVLQWEWILARFPRRRVAQMMRDKVAAMRRVIPDFDAERNKP